MSAGNRLASLQHVRARICDGEWMDDEARGEIPAFEILHHEIRGARIELADIHDTHDVLALDLHRCARFTREPLRRRRIVRELGVEELDGNPLVEPKMHRSDDDAHPTRAEHALDTKLAGDHLPLAHAFDPDHSAAILNRSAP